MFYEIIPDVSSSNNDPRKNIGPHVDDIIGSADAKSTYLVTNQLKDLSLRQYVEGKDLYSSSTHTHSVDVHSI